MDPRLRAAMYVKVEGLIPDQLAGVCARYARAQARLCPSGSDGRTLNSHSVYGDFLMESLLDFLTDRMERETGLGLWPTYSYYRVYRRGSTLMPHKDRPSCEVSLSLCLGYDYKREDYEWPIAMGREPVVLKPGDGVIYLGCEIEHWRPPLHVPDEGWHAQVFLHYVDKNGPNSQYKYDQRDGLYVARAET